MHTSLSTSACLLFCPPFCKAGVPRGFLHGFLLSLLFISGLSNLIHTYGHLFSHLRVIYFDLFSMIALHLPMGGRHSIVEVFRGWNFLLPQQKLDESIRVPHSASPRVLILIVISLTSSVLHISREHQLHCGL